MFRTFPSRKMTILGLLVLVAAVVSAQGSGEQRDEGMPELLVEVRALRAEVNQAAGASMRMQLLLARLTLQEQRIASIGRQVLEVQEKLRTAGRERAEAQAHFAELDHAMQSGRMGAEEGRRQVGIMLRRLSERLSEQSTHEQQLRGEESELLAALSAEQGRWMEFNTRLDELERSLPARAR